MLYRHGRTVIALAVLIALAGAATMIGSEAYRDMVGLSLFGVLALAFAGSLVVSNVACRHGPRTLRISGDGFTTPRHGGGLLMLASMFPLIGIGIAAAGIEATSGRHVVLGIAGVAVGLILLAGLAASLRTVPSVDFTRRGLTLTRLAGTIVVPWDALDPGRPTVRRRPPASSTLVIARPDLVERQGITGVSNAIVAEGVPVDLLLDAIRVYVGDPGRRAAIGTSAELDRLHAELPTAVPVPLAERPVREPGVTITGLAIRALLLAGSLTVEALTSNWWLEQAARTISGVLVISMAGKVHPMTWFRQRFAGNPPAPPRPE
ncbi:hypothetical protein ACTOB_005012 [Actinoplanes oblitus]|uniref:Uncharacterized protein n=1 Tax=Actinoplanes oblitus TaxID=3040509 RepID=A0ABY8W6T3_9ACTN|nr:hypothetical protein [Actinoplanes oblitus]WIM93047.1 hypothetical protein ACTOB_005012 [Actinoplanes oblitus]